MGVQTISTGQAAELCGVTPDTVLKWIKRGQIDAQRTPGGHYRIRKDQLTPYVSGKRSPSTLNDPELSDREKLTFCWEYHARDGKVHAGCRKCLVFQAKARNCYRMAKLGAESGYEGMHCIESCNQCQYFRYISKSRYNVLVITEDAGLTARLESNLNDPYIVRFASCGYEAATSIHDVQPDYIIIDDSMERIKTKEITVHMLKDGRLKGAQIVIAVDSTVAVDRLRQGICAVIKLPLDARDLEYCFQNLRMQLLGLHQ